MTKKKRINEPRKEVFGKNLMDVRIFFISNKIPYFIAKKKSKSSNRDALTNGQIPDANTD
tara:strand:+ start:43 stop:222 length:180 start_codon:yes stop_codon:yes gene_type:complete